MNCRIELTEIFLRRMKMLAKRYKSLKQDLERLQAELRENPYMGADMGNRLHKVCLAIASKGKGKRGGARVITYTLSVQADEVEITLLTIYDKSDQESISDRELQYIMRESGLL